MKHLLAFALATLMLAGCSSSASSGRYSVVTTIFAEYEWAKAVVGDTDKIELRLLMDNGLDPHSYSPSIEDISLICKADFFVYVGGESDYWVPAALKNVTNPKQQRLNLLEFLGERTHDEEEIEGMQGEGEEEPVKDEHVWLSLRNAVSIVESLRDRFSELDASNAAAYAQNAAAYCAKLRALDEQYTQAVSEGRVNTLLFADRFPFLYMVKDYGLDYFAAFSGCSAESEASADTIVFLARKVDELSLKSVLKIETSDGRLARTVVDSTQSKDQTILTLNSMQAVRQSEGTTYLGVMEQNLTVLKEALS